MQIFIRPLVTILAIAICCHGHAQSYLIGHDLNSNKTRIYRVSDNDTLLVKKVRTRKHPTISLEVDNYNPYFWNARITPVRKTQDDAAGNAGVFNPFSLLGKGLGGMFKELLPDLGLAGALSRGGPADMSTANGKYLYYAQEYQELYTRYQTLSEKEEEIVLMNLQLQAIKYNPHKTGAELKSEASRILHNTLRTEQLQPDAALKMGRELDLQEHNISDSIMMIKKILDNLSGSIDRNHEEGDLTLGQIADRVERSCSSTSQVCSGKSTRHFGAQLTQSAELYQEIQQTDYKFLYTTTGETDIEKLKLELFPRKDSFGRDTITKYFVLEEKRGLKIRNSVGLSFAHYADKSRNYYVASDSTIGTANGDEFTPVLSVFINFYPNTAGSIKLGGTLGVGIPVSGERKDINYLLGLSALIGNREPIVITGGLAGTTVNVLGRGLRTGSKVSSTEYVIPMVPVFRIGYFLGVSINLASFTSK